MVCRCGKCRASLNRNYALPSATRGIGISKENKQRVFDPFFQADSSYSRSYNGLGLGLSIVRQLTERLQGTVELESEIGEGTTAILTIPVRVHRTAS